MNEAAATWRAIWRLIDSRRIELGMSKAELYRSSRVSEKTMMKMRDDGVPLATDAKRASLCYALGWTSDSIERILRGDEPQVLPGSRLGNGGDMADDPGLPQLGPDTRAALDKLAAIAAAMAQAEAHLAEVDERLAGIESALAEDRALLDSLEQRLGPNC